MKKIIIVFFVILLFIYVVCAICVPIGLYDWDTYFKIVAIVGGLASIVGLGAAAFVKIDLLSYDAEAMQRIASAAKEIENKEHQIKDASEQLATLEYKKEELEVLVKKASLVLFCKEELSRLYEKLLSLISKNEELNNVIMSIPQLENQLSQLEGEMDENPEIRDILKTIEKAKSRNKTEIVVSTLLGALSFRL